MIFSLSILKMQDNLVIYFNCSEAIRWQMMVNLRFLQKHRREGHYMPVWMSQSARDDDRLSRLTA